MTKKKMGLLLISHDLAVVEGMVDRVVVLFAGRVVEEGPTREIFASPMHPYTRALFDAAPGHQEVTKVAGQTRRWFDGTIPDSGCRFAARCNLIENTCRTTEPDLTRLDTGRGVRCPVVLSEDGK